MKFREDWKVKVRTFLRAFLTIAVMLGFVLLTTLILQTTQIEIQVQKIYVVILEIFLVLYMIYHFKHHYEAPRQESGI